VEKRDRTGVRAHVPCGLGLRTVRSRGSTCGTAEGMRRDIRSAAKVWVWLVVASPGLVIPKRRRQWVRTFDIRAGRLTSSVHQRAFFP
jgi:hypothetical protein